MSGHRVQKVMVVPITMIFKLLQSKKRVQIWLVEQLNAKIEGQIIGFDEYMNVVLDDAEEFVGTKRRVKLGRILLKGDNITLLSEVKE